jgi:3-dehydroquinate dehydratase/shikimate dehydrogenase
MPSDTLLAVPITSAQQPLDEQVRQAHTAGADLVELRVDLIGDAPAVEQLLAGPRARPMILTVRAPDEGGAWTGSEAERLALIQRLGLLNPGYIDVEYATWQRSANIRQKIGLVCRVGTAAGDVERPKNELILSHHDWSGTPDDLDPIVDALAATPAAVIKLAVTARDASDACRVLAQLRRRARGRRMIALAMGEGGLASRVLSRREGAFLSYAALGVRRASAPGQPSIGELRGLYGWEAIGTSTRAWGVVGWPASHSLGPAIHNAGMRAAGIDGVYLPLPVAPGYETFAGFMEQNFSASAPIFCGLSVTLPHKENAFRWLAQTGGRMSALAKRCGAVNTLRCGPDGLWDGENTDAIGVQRALAGVVDAEAARRAALRVVVLGAGGMARAAVVGLQAWGCEVMVLNRTAERGAALARALGCGHGPWAARTAADADLLVNCTPVGMWPKVDESPLPPEAFRAGLVVLDTVYRPGETRLLREARACGSRVVSGERVFIGQAAGQYAYWHGRAVPEGVFERVMASLSDGASGAR